MATGGIVSSFIAARDAAADRARQRTQDAYVAARRPVVDAQNDQMAALKLQEGQQQVENAADDRTRGLARDEAGWGTRILGYLAPIKAKNPDVPLSELAQKNVPPQYLAQAGLDKPEKLALFAQHFDNVAPEQIQQLVDHMGDDPVTGHVAIQDPTTGKKGIAYTRKSGRVENSYDAAPAPKEFAPVDPEMQAAKLKLLGAQADKAERPSAAGGGQSKVIGGELVGSDGKVLYAKDVGPTSQRAGATALEHARSDRGALVEALNSADALVGRDSAGIAAHIKQFGGPPANLKAYLDTIKAKTGLAALQALKAQGVTLGQVTEGEHKLLQDQIASIDQIQDPQQLRKQLRVIAKQSQRVVDLMQADYDRAFPGGKSASVRSDVPDDIKAILAKHGG